MIEELYQNAITAIRKKSPMPADRNAVKNFMDQMRRGAWGRFQEVRQETLGRSLYEGTDPGAMRVNMKPIDLQLERFANGADLPQEVRGLIEVYLQGLFANAQSEQRRHRRLLSRLQGIERNPVFAGLVHTQRGLA